MPVLGKLTAHLVLSLASLSPARPSFLCYLLALVVVFAVEYLPVLSLSHSSFLLSLVVLLAGYLPFVVVHCACGFLMSCRALLLQLLVHPPFEMAMIAPLVFDLLTC